MSKTHFATCEKATECDNNEYWGDSLCGIWSENVSDDIGMVTCMHCLKIINRNKVQYFELYAVIPVESDAHNFNISNISH